MIISPSTLNNIRRKVGPVSDGSLVDLMQTSTVKTSYGPKNGPLKVRVADVAASFQFMGRYETTGKLFQGLPRVDADAILSVDATADLRNHDIVVKKALPWQASRYYSESQEVINVTGSLNDSSGFNGKIYTCVTSGVTGSVSPTWPTVQGETVTDGAAVWRCEGDCQQFVVTEIWAPRTFGDYISRKAYVKFRQDEVQSG